MKGTPQPIVDRMRQRDPRRAGAANIKEAWARNGSDIPTLEGEAFGRFVSSEVQRWRRVVTDANIKLEN